MKIANNAYDIESNGALMSFHLPKERLLVDRRWEGNTGIGRYSRELIPRISGLVDDYLEGGNPVSLKQMGLSFIRGQRFANFYSPGYVPLFGVSRQLITIHDLILLEPEIRDKSKFLFFNQIILPRIKDGSVQVITVSKTSRQAISDWASISEENIVIVPNGLSAGMLQIGNELSIVRSERSLVFVGNMKKHKNFRLFAEAVNLLRDSWKVRLVGPNLDRDLIDKRHEVLTYWNISDYELGSIYNDSSILVNTSSHEGFGMSFLEGGYLGCKIVHLGVLPTVRDILGEDTFHTKGSYSPDHLADLIVQVSREPGVPKVRENLARDYSWEKSGRILIDILTKL